jgi:hypothetical protein
MTAIIDIIEKSVAELIAALPKADHTEAIRVLTRIDELESLRKQYAT